MLVASLDPEIYLKSQRTQRRMVGVVVHAITSAFEGDAKIDRIAGHRLIVHTDAPDAVDRLSRVFGVRAVETVDAVPVEGVDDLAARVASRFAPVVAGHTFAVRPHRIGNHDWSSQDLAIATGTLLVKGGGRVDLTAPEVTVRVRVAHDIAYLTLASTAGVGGLPPGVQGKALAMFSGGIDSPVAAYLVAQRGVALDYLHFSLGCGQADHAAGIAHLLQDLYGAGTDPTLHIVDLEPAVAQIQVRTSARNRQMALKGTMYRIAERVAATDPRIRAVVNGESLGQVSSQTLDNIAALDRLVTIPMLRPLIGLAKNAIITKARDIGTLDMSTRTRETCDISAGAKVTVSMTAADLTAVTAGLEDLVDQAVLTSKSMRLADWVPGS